MMVPVICTLMMFARATCGQTFLNDYDKPLNFTCAEKHQAISTVQSRHWDVKEDRQFAMSCVDVIYNSNRYPLPTCTWTGYENEYTQLLAFECPGNGYITGWESIHNDHYEDRKWRFYCCSIKYVHMSNCDYTDWTNTYDNSQNYIAPDRMMITGVISTFSPKNNDRIYKYEVCQAREVWPVPVV